jgi:hypothetical protein
MITPREPIYQALFALGQAIKWTWNGNSQNWASSARKLRDWSEVPSQPALFQRQFNERPTQQRGQGGGFGTTKWPLFVQWWVYLQAPNPDAPGNWPSTYLNTVMDAITLALTPPSPSTIALARGLPGEGLTLAGFSGPNGTPGPPLVENVWIEGDVIEKDPVGADTQIVLVIPIRISTAL